MRNPLRDPLKQEKSSLQVVPVRRREFLSCELLYLLLVKSCLHLNLRKTEESSLLVNIDRAHSVVKSNVKVFYLILDKKRASSHVIREKRTPSQKTDRTLQLHDKQESFVYASVDKKRPPFSLGKVRSLDKERDPDCPLYLFKRCKRACAKEKRLKLLPTFKQRRLVLPQESVGEDCCD